VTGRTAEADKTALSKEDDVAAGGHDEAVDLGLDVDDRFSLKPCNIDFNVEVINALERKPVYLSRIHCERKKLKLTSRQWHPRALRRSACPG
jgi:hypothetical protein